MRIDATLISHCNNGINLNEDKMKTIGDRIEQLLRDFGRTRHKGAAPAAPPAFSCKTVSTSPLTKRPHWRDSKRSNPTIK